MRDRVKVGIIGCGNISGTYLERMCNTFEILDVVACADIVEERARAKAEEYPGVKPMGIDELLADPEIEIVVNLTVPKAHAEVALGAIKAGKSVHNEKPLATNRKDAKKMLDLAAKKGVLIGCAPDTFLGGGHQTCRKLIDDGAIGEPVAAVAFFSCRGHERWHPDPEFYYKPGGGPILDMGPYYITVLVNMLGPVRRVTGSTRVTFPERTITSKPKHGTKIRVEVPTHVAGVMDFQNGAVGTIITSYDIWAANLPHIEVYGTEGSLSVPDPDGFGGPVRITRSDAHGWEEVTLTHGYAENNRGIGPADMAYALRSGRGNRAGGELAYHVLDVMCSFQEASEKGRHVTLKSTCERPAALPVGLAKGQLDE
jgi:predicted dehydrogenase